MRSRKSILLVHNGDGLSHEGISGGTLRSFEIFRRWARLPNISAHAVTTVGGAKKLADAGITLPATVLRASVRARREPFRSYRFFSYVVSVLDSLWRHREIPSVDMAFTASDFFCDTLVAHFLKRRRREVAWVACVHHLYSSPWRRPGNPIVNWTWFILQRQSLAVIARHASLAFVYDTDEGDRVRRVLVRMGMPERRIHAMWNGVDFKRFDRPVGREPEYAGIFVGQLRPNKGIADIVPIWSKVLSVLPDARLAIVGHGSPETCAALARDIRRAGLQDHVILLGEMSGDSLVEAYQNARLFFMPSHEEGWGIAICEAMASGLPVVAYDLPAYARHYRAVIHHVPCFDIDAFAKETVRLLQSPGACAVSARHGRDLAASFDWDTIALRDWSAIQSLLYADAPEKQYSGP